MLRAILFILYAFFPGARKQRRMDKSHVSIREYYCYRLPIQPQCLSIFLQSGRLLQQYIVDQYINIETQRLDYYRSEQHQKKHR